MEKFANHKWGDNVVIYQGASIDDSVEIGPFCIIYPNVTIKAGVRIMSSVIVGKGPTVGKNQVKLIDPDDLTILEEDTFVGDQVIIYKGSKVGSNVYLADKSLIRENVVLRDNVVIGTSTVVSFNAFIDRGSKVMTACNICGNMKVGKNVFIGVHVCSVADNTPQQLSQRNMQTGPVISDDVFVGSNTTILPAVKIKKGITVGSGSIVTKDLDKENSLYMGCPAKLVRAK